MEININDEEKPIIIKINWYDGTYWDGNARMFKDTNLPLNGKYEDEYGTILYYKNGKYNNENGPAYIQKDGYKIYYINDKPHRIDGPAVIWSDVDYAWGINGYYIKNETIDNWLTENDIPLDWNIWSDEDKMLFALHWSDYNNEFGHSI